LKLIGLFYWNMLQKALSVLKYIISLALAGGLFWYIYRDQDMGEMIDKLKGLQIEWVFLSIFISLLSHLSRAFRWTIALRPLGHRINLTHAFLGVMVGYLMNLFLPRAGEIARCSLLKKLDNVPVASSFGAVVAERTVDLLILAVLILVILVFEYQRIGNLLDGGSDALIAKLPWLIGLALVGIIGLALFFALRPKLMAYKLFAILYTFLDSLMKGLLSVFRLDRKDFILYGIHSLLIWLFYYLMAYVLFFSMEETAHLGMMCCLTVLVMGSLGVIIPTPGGVGSYHLFVSATFLAYQVTEKVGEYFAFLMHASQTITILIVGAIAAFMSALLVTRSSNAISKNHAN